MAAANKYGLKKSSPTIEYEHLDLQILDIEIRDIVPAGIEYDERHMVTQQFRTRLPPRTTERGTACTVLLYTINEHGENFVVRVNKFKPCLTYEYGSLQAQKSIVSNLQDILKCNLDTELIKAKHLFGWVPSDSDATEAKKFNCVKIYFPTIATYREALRLGAVSGSKPWESKVDFVMSFFDKTSLIPSGWMRVNNFQYSDGKISHCSKEIVCNMNDVRPIEKMNIAPILIASVDIECFSKSGGFPQPDNQNDTISIIGTSFWRVGTPIEDITSIVQCLGPCADVEDSIVESYKTEKELLDAWRDLITVHSDADIVIGYNQFGFDYKYMGERAKMFRCDRYHYHSKIISDRSELVKKELSSNALGQNEMFLLGWKGRIDIDVFKYIAAQYKLQMYKLDSVAEHFLGVHKVDLPYQTLFECLNGTPEQMAKACFYCAEDCRLPLKLAKRLEIIPSMVEMSRVTHTPINQLVMRGQQIKVFNQIVWHSHRMGYVLNDPKHSDSDEGYEGATVIEPTPGFYTTPVATLDFASLYPSIMLAHNLCFSTWVTDNSYMNIQGVTYENHKASEKKNYTFVTSTQGVLPQILRSLLAARKQAKKEMAKADSYELKALFNARQLALKVSCNSVYGFTGAVKRGMYPCVAIADSVTCQGRAMIEKTKDLVQEYLPCTVIYGDTDSVMINFHDENITIDEAFKKGDDAAEYISNTFHEDVTLEMEKVYKPYLLIAKKRYAGLMYTPNKKGEIELEKMDAKGVELVRRDNCPFAKQVYERVLKPILYDISPETAVSNLRNDMNQLKLNEIPLEQFVLSKQMKKKESYANELQPHLIVCDKMNARLPGSGPQTGDRVPFFIAEGPQAKVSERAEDPGYGKANNVKVDRLYYLEHQIVKPVSTLFAPFDKLNTVVDTLFRETVTALDLQKNNQKTLSDFFTMQSSGSIEHSAAEPIDIGDALAVSFRAPPPAKRAKVSRKKK